MGKGRVPVAAILGDLGSEPLRRVEAHGILRSGVFPGLWLDPAAMIGGDSARVLAVVLQGLGSVEHADFLARLGGGGPQ